MVMVMIRMACYAKKLINGKAGKDLKTLKECSNATSSLVDISIQILE